MSVYFLSLNLVSCSDDAVNTNDVSVTEVATSHTDGGLEIDFCSPFCQCNCCHVHVTPSSLVGYTIISPEISSEVNLHTKHIEDQFQNSILQPPRV